MFKLYDIVKPKQDVIKSADFIFKSGWLTLVTEDNLEACNNYKYLLDYCGNAVYMNPHLAKQ